MTKRLHNGLFKCTDIYNDEKWYSDDVAEFKKKTKEYIDECEGDCILVYRVYNYKTGKYRRMTDKEIKEAEFPR